MGSRGAFLESGGFSKPLRWQTVDYIEGIKVLAPKDSRSSLSLPERSNTPGTTYIMLRQDGSFRQLITFDNDRMPIYEIDYGQHAGVKSLHVHYYKNGDRYGSPVILHKGDALYKKYKNLLRGVEL